jgi:hypothetical protein
MPWARSAGASSGRFRFGLRAEAELWTSAPEPSWWSARRQGGLEPLRTHAAGLPRDLPAVAVVLHVSPTRPSRLPKILTRALPGHNRRGQTVTYTVRFAPLQGTRDTGPRA